MFSLIITVVKTTQTQEALPYQKSSLMGACCLLVCHVQCTQLYHHSHSDIFHNSLHRIGHKIGMGSMLLCTHIPTQMYVCMLPCTHTTYLPVVGLHGKF